MKGVQLIHAGASDDIAYVDLPRPRPSPHEVLVRVSAASVNFADVMMRKGVYPHMPPLPATLGLDCSGVVEDVGAGVDDLHVGQAVIAMGFGCYAEYLVTKRSWVFPLPSETADWNAAATLPVAYLTAYHLLHTMARADERHTALVYAAAGGVGTAIAQLAQLIDTKVIGLVGRDDKRAYALSHGYHEVINYRTTDVVDAVEHLTGGKGVDFVFNSVAGDTFERDFRLLAPFGQILWYGTAGGEAPSTIFAHWRQHFGKSGGIRFFSLTSLFDQASSLLHHSMDALVAALSNAHIRPSIHDALPLQEAPRALALLEQGDVLGKLVLVPPPA